MKKQRVLFLILFGVLVILIGGLIIGGNSLAIQYHRNLMMSDWNMVIKLGGSDPRQSDYVKSYDKHKNALVQLGYFAKMEFPLRNIRIPSLEFRRLWEELQARYFQYPHVEGGPYESKNPMIVVWDRPYNRSKWEKIIAAHDAPSRNTLEGSPKNDFSRFIGRWGESKENISYSISKDSAGRLKVEIPPIDKWRIQIKSLRLEGTKLLFDVFHYMPPLNGFKTINNRYDDHPFSGMRCEIILETRSEKPDELIERLSTFQLPKEVTGILKRNNNP
jgi:hypothetical protein